MIHNYEEFLNEKFNMKKLLLGAGVLAVLSMTPSCTSEFDRKVDRATEIVKTSNPSIGDMFLDELQKSDPKVYNEVMKKLYSDISEVEVDGKTIKVDNVKDRIKAQELNRSLRKWDKENKKMEDENDRLEDEILVKQGKMTQAEADKRELERMKPK